MKTLLDSDYRQVGVVRPFAARGQQKWRRGGASDYLSDNGPATGRTRADVRKPLTSTETYDSPGRARPRGVWQATPFS